MKIKKEGNCVHFVHCFPSLRGLGLRPKPHTNKNTNYKFFKYKKRRLAPLGMLTFFEEALPLISLKIIFEKFNIILRGCRGDSPDYKGEQTVRSLRAKKSNYNLKSRGFSFLETIITVSIALIISFILFGLIFSMNKSFVKISENLKKEKEIENFKNILSSHIEYNESVEFRILNASSDYSIPKFKEIFKLEQANQKIKGNFLILKFTRISDIKNKEVEINYRTFFFVDKKLKISYFIEGDIGTHGGFISQTKIVEKCEGSFEGENNLLKVFIENLDKGEKNYEFLLSF